MPRFRKLKTAGLACWLPLHAIPAHPWRTVRPDLGACHLKDRLRTQQRILQPDRTRVRLELMRSLWAKVHTAMPCTVGAIAEEKQPAAVQADHSTSPKLGEW